MRTGVEQDHRHLRGNDVYADIIGLQAHSRRKVMRTSTDNESYLERGKFVVEI